MLSTLRSASRAPAILRTLGQPKRARQKVENFRDAQIRKIVGHAHANVPFYRRLYDEHGVVISRIHGFEDLALLPVVTRQELQRATSDDLIARGVDSSKLKVRTTQGTTGEPLVVRRMADESLVLRLFFFQAFRSFGVGPRDLALELRVPAPQIPFIRTRARKLADVFRFYPRLAVDTRDIEATVRTLIEKKPPVIGGWPSILGMLATRLRRESPSVMQGWPRILQTGGERVDPAVRRQVEGFFRAPVYDMYSSWEFDLIAWQCRHLSNYHTSDESVAVEVLDANGRPARAGETGDLVGTALHSYANPFIRYRLGDNVTQGNGLCECGAPLGTIKAIEGRAMETFTSADGRIVSVYKILAAIALSGRWVRQAQVVREADNRLLLRLAPLRSPSDAEVRAVSDAVADYVGKGIECSAVIADDLRSDSQGKFRSFVDRR